MNKSKEIFQFLYQNGLSANQTAKALNISRSTVQSYNNRFRELMLTYEKIKDMPTSELENLLFPNPITDSDTKTVKGNILPDFVYISKELKKKGVTLRLLWQEYKSEFDDHLGYSQFCDWFHKYRKENNLEMKRQYKAGDYCQVDYSGDRPSYIDTDTGEVVYCELFVINWNATNYIYCEAQPNQKLESWCQGHVNAFEFFGCVPKKLIPDNYKGAVTKAHRYDPDANPTYVNLCHHYNVAVIPARPGEPRDKGKVENAVLQTQRWILARLRNVVCYSIEELNDNIKTLLEELNRKPMKGYGERSRKELFEELEKPEAQNLPQQRWEMKHWKYCRVGIDYCVSIDKHNYSVPYIHTGKKVLAVIGPKTIEVYLEQERIAIHRRNYKKGGYSFDENHRPQKHRQVLAWTPQRLTAWASRKGENTARYIKALIESKRHPEEGYRPALGVLRLLDEIEASDAERVCEFALQRRMFRIRQLKSVLKSPWLKQGFSEPEKGNTIQHENLHGMHNYAHNFDMKEDI